MKRKILSLAIIGVMVFSMAACGNKTEESNNTSTAATTEEGAENASAAATTEADADITSTVETTEADAAEVGGQRPDYSLEDSWYQIPEVTKDVDTFYIMGTRYFKTSMEDGASDYAAMDNPEMVETAPIEYMKKASVYEESTNVFVPFYRQAGMRIEGEAWKETGSIDEAVSRMPYEDITSALDYYFENYNEGRPFIIAAHSQGSAILKLVLKNYFKEHPDYYERMVAAYAIGYSFTKEDFEENPHMKFATGEKDTGVIISWNTEGKENVEEDVSTCVLLPNAISINPLNWKLDDTYAPASENLGSRIFNAETNEIEPKDVGADAQVDTERGVVVTNADCTPTEMPEFFGTQSYHSEEILLYYDNIRDNVAKRIAAYLKKN